MTVHNIKKPQFKIKEMIESMTGQLQEIIDIIQLRRN